MNLMRMPTLTILLVWPVLLVGLGTTTADTPETVPQGTGSYAVVLPAGAKRPPETIYRTENARGAMPTNDWWSSLAWLPFSERHYPHPLAVEAGPAGLRLYYPGSVLRANKSGIFGTMPGKSGDDLILGHAAQDQFPDARVDGFSDWFVAIRFARGEQRLRVTYGHGSPFVFALYEGGDPRLTFAKAPQIFSGNERSAVLGVTINGKSYGLFGASGSSWTGLGTKTFTNHAAGKPYFAVAVLPDASVKTLALFTQYAYSHVTDTRVAWSYEPKNCTVKTTFTFTTTPHEGEQKGTLFALYPHQWRNAGAMTFHAEYASVRGKMKLAEGTTFHTTMRFPGVLPGLPRVEAVDQEKVAAYLLKDVGGKAPPIRDTYAEGKWLGKLATLIPLAEQYGQAETARTLRDQLRQRLESWFSAEKDGRRKDSGLFYYDDRWGTLIGYPASFGSDQELNDHHFHYGYFVKAAAEIARHDSAWPRDERWGGMVKLLIRDMTSADRQDKLFPFLRNFDPYAGHSWASGHARFADGNNNESSSEAMNAWAGIILWGEATGERALRDLGIYLYTTEMQGINEYWFDVLGANRPLEYTPSVVTMVWGGQGVNSTWFSARPEHVHGINWMPIHGSSLYLGRHPVYVAKNYAALVQESGGTSWKQWSDLIWMYRAMSDPADAVALYEASGDKIIYESGNSRTNTYTWLYSLNGLGQVDAEVSADYPLYAVFRKGNTRTYCVYNMEQGPRTVTFSDGVQLQAGGKGFHTAKAMIP
jgi:endoglucanase Acf2